MRDKTKGNIALLTTAIVWGTGFIGQKLGMATLPAIGFNGSRQFLAMFVLLPIALAGLKKSGYFDKTANSIAVLDERYRRTLKGGLVCGIFMSLGTNLQQIGLVTVSAGKSGFITAIYIVLVPLFSIFLGVKLTKKVVLCCTIAMVGFAFLSLRGGLGGITAGDWLTLASAACFALQIIAVNYFVDKDNDLTISVIQMFVTGVSSLLISFIFENYTWGGFVACLPVLIYMACVPTAIGFTLQIVGQKYTDSTTASFLMSLESVFAVIFGALILGEHMSGKELIGCVLIFVANLLIQMGDAEKKEA
ncbi:MAG: DMT family transporter [Clostridiales bacterium]|nr:DMT family transporter [Candidatus Crickella merdequi]